MPHALGTETLSGSNLAAHSSFCNQSDVETSFTLRITRWF
jgi:hypothetical protein